MLLYAAEKLYGKLQSLFVACETHILCQAVNRKGNGIELLLVRCRSSVGIDRPEDTAEFTVDECVGHVTHLSGSSLGVLCDTGESGRSRESPQYAGIENRPTGLVGMKHVVAVATAIVTAVGCSHFREPVGKYI